MELDRVLLELPKTGSHSNDEGDIDNGEYWGELEESDIENDLSNSEPCDQMPEEFNQSDYCNDS